MQLYRPSADTNCESSPYTEAANEVMVSAIENTVGIPYQKVQIITRSLNYMRQDLPSHAPLHEKIFGSKKTIEVADFSRHLLKIPPGKDFTASYPNPD
jgi:hypothetical protein